MAVKACVDELLLGNAGAMQTDLSYGVYLGNRRKHNVASEK
jgi:hypothetical protein